MDSTTASKAKLNNYDLLAEHNPSGLFLIKDHRIIQANSSFYKIIGREEEQVLNQLTSEFLSLEDHQLMSLSIMSLMSGQVDKKDLICELKSSHGTSKHILFQLSRIKDHNEEAYFIAGSASDVTAKQVEYLELKKTRQNFRAMYCNSIDGMLIYNYNSDTMEDCNDTAVQLLGYANREEIKRINRYNIIPKFSKMLPGMNLHEKMKSHGDLVRKGQAIRSPAIFLRKDGSELLVKLSIIPTFNNTGEAFIVFYDNTEKITTSLKLQEKNRELKSYIESNMQLENFAYIASHDLSTPIRSIISFTQLLQRSLKDRITESEQEYMDFITKASSSMKALINDLLAYSRVNTNDNQIVEIATHSLLSEIIMEFNYDLNQKKGIIKIGQLPKKIHGDQIKLKQLIQNLISNALKFSRKDAAPLIHITSEETPTEWRFFIKDNGIGIESEFQERIFLLFKRLHNNTEYEGTGIGLALCKKIIEQHHGKIGFESTPGKGTKFHFSISKSLQLTDSNETE